MTKTLTKKIILDTIQKAINENGGEDFNLIDDEQTERLYTYLTQNLDLESAYYVRNGNGDYWNQIEYYSKKLHKTIIWDYDDYDDYDELADSILSVEKEIAEFEAKITISGGSEYCFTSNPKMTTKDKTKQIKQKLEYLRGEIEAERISYGEIAELQSLAKYIDPGDVQLLEWAAVEECQNKDSNGNACYDCESPTGSPCGSTVEVNN